MVVDWDTYLNGIYALLREFLTTEVNEAEPSRNIHTMRSAAIEFLEQEFKLYIASQQHGICGYPCSGHCMSCDLSTKLSAIKNIDLMIAEIVQNSD